MAASLRALCLPAFVFFHSIASADPWLDRFQFVPPEMGEAPQPMPRAASPEFIVSPAAAGPQTVRVALPFGAGSAPPGGPLTLSCEGAEIPGHERVLTAYTGPGHPIVRRSIVTFRHDFQTLRPHRFTCAVAAAHETASSANSSGFTIGGTEIEIRGDEIIARADGALRWEARPIAPTRSSTAPARVEFIEHHPLYVWARVLLPDAEWPRILEIRIDAAGNAALRLHLQRMGPEGGAPEMGWSLRVPQAMESVSLKTDPHDRARCSALWAGREVHFLDAAAVPGRHVQVMRGAAADSTELRYRRALAEDQLPHQRTAWRTAAVALLTPGAAPLNDLLEAEHRIAFAPGTYEKLHGLEPRAELTPWPLLDAVRAYHDEAMSSASAPEPDFGNVTGMPRSGPYGMNRLNHAPPIFHAAHASGMAAVRDTALRWCANFHDLSIWWGEDRPGEFGGTRYNNRAVDKAFPHDPKFMWRSDSAVHFCTKGYDAFLLAYEETGDPRYAAALRWQVGYAARMVHADQGEARNIGDVLDFVRLYEMTGVTAHLDSALRLFRELRAKLSTGDLFSQSGAPIVPDPPFIDDDDAGYKHPFAKPYIIGYALAGLPALARHPPEEPKLRDVIRAVADFLAASQDPLGGWRYPHPASSRMIIDQGMEHAAQLSRAAAFLEARGEAIGNLLDAIERALRVRVLGFARSGAFVSGLSGWEHAAGVLTDGKSLHDLYARPQDRDRARDYAEGAIGIGGASPEGVVYFPEVLDFYLKHRPADRLLSPGRELASVLARMDPAENSFDAWRAQNPPPAEFLPFGIEQHLPVFSADRVARMDFPLRFTPERFADFSAWRAQARATLLECLQTPPPRAAFDPALIAREDRGSYEARKLVFNVSADCRVPAYLLVPHAPGPHPAVLALHDHGAHFSIGKEKVVRPFAVDPAVAKDAEDWAAKNYGGRFPGDELARRGFAVLAVDALFWGERGRKEGVKYEAQETLAANLLQLGMTWSGVITWDDMRSAEFLAAQPEVDPDRIAAAGLSMGCHRTWMLCAATDRIKAGLAICWMGDTPALAAPGNNQTKGQSAHSMIVPELRNHLDYPDVASIACPKPMLFYNGEQDGLFPVPGVERSYALLRSVWESQGRGDALETRLWPVPHEFNIEMQDAAFDWLQTRL